MYWGVILHTNFPKVLNFREVFTALTYQNIFFSITNYNNPIFVGNNGSGRYWGKNFSSSGLHKPFTITLHEHNPSQTFVFLAAFGALWQIFFLLFHS